MLPKPKAYVKMMVKLNECIFLLEDEYLPEKYSTV